METVALLYEDYQKELAEDFKNTFLKRASDTDSSRSNDTVIDEVTDMLSTNIAVYTEKLLQRWGFSSGGEGGGGGDVTVTLDDLLKKYLSDNYVTIKGDQEVFGEKDFRKGIRIAGRRLYWDEGNDALVIEGAAYTTRWLSAKGVSPGGGGAGSGGAAAMYQLIDVSPNDTKDAVLGAEKDYVLTFDGSFWRGMPNKGGLSSKLFTALDKEGNEVNPDDENAEIYAIRANYSLWSVGFLSAKGISDGGTGGGGGGAGSGGAAAMYQLIDVSPNDTKDAVLGAEKDYVLTFDGSFWRGMPNKGGLSSKLFTALDKEGNEVNPDDENAEIYAIRANYSLWSVGFLSAKGISDGGTGGGGGGAVALYQLLDVEKNADITGVAGATKGSVLTFNGDKWYADKPKTAAGISNLFTALDNDGNEVDLNDESKLGTITNIRANYALWSVDWISAKGKSSGGSGGGGGLINLVYGFESLGGTFDNNDNSATFNAFTINEIWKLASSGLTNVTVTGSGNAVTDVTKGSDGRSLTFTKGSTFATKSEFDALNTKFNDFLTGSDADDIINKWSELEVFLQGMKESDNLAVILQSKMDKTAFSNLFTALDNDGNEVDLNDESKLGTITNIRANYALWSVDWISAKGKSSGGSGGGGGLINLVYGFESLGGTFDNNDNSATFNAFTINEIWKLASSGLTNVTVTGSGNAVTDVTKGSDGRSLTFTKGSTFATKSEFDALNTKFNDFLTGSDADDIINKWSELEVFLQGMKESDNLAVILQSKMDKTAFSKLFTALDASGNEVDPSDDTKTIASIRANFGFWGVDYISAKGVSKGSGGTGGASTLYQLVDVLANDTEDGVEGAAAGKALVFDGTHWRAGDAGLNESQLYSYLTANKYLTQSAADSRYVTSSRKVIAGTGLSGGGALTSDVTLSLGTSGVVAGTYTKVMVDAYGRVTSGTNLSATDIPNLDWSKITTGKPTTLAGYGITDAYTKTEADRKYVTIATAQTVSGAKTFSATMKTASVLPSTDANSALGGTANRWSNVYSVNGVFSQNVTAKLLSASESLQIGDAYLKWDAANNAVYVVKKDGTTPVGFYSTDWLSAKGVSMPGVQTGTLADLNDVEITDPTNGQALKYDAASKKWVNGTIDSFNVNQMWAELKKADSSKVIDASHIPTSVLDGRWVTLSTNQTITGQKTFTQNILFSNNITGIRNTAGNLVFGAGNENIFCILNDYVGPVAAKNNQLILGNDVGYWKKVTAGQYISKVATGVSPLIVSSNTLVNNLNADLLDGYHQSSFLRADGVNQYVTLYSGDGNNEGYRLVFEGTVTSGWSINSMTLLVNSRHAGTGMISIVFHTTNQESTRYIGSLNYYGSTISLGDTMWRLFYNTTTKKVRLFWRFYDYSDCQVSILNRRGITTNISNKTWYTTIPSDSGSELPAYYNWASSAHALATSRTLWGQPFNGTANVSGDMTGVGNITMSGVLTIKNSTYNKQLIIWSAGSTAKNQGEGIWFRCNDATREVVLRHEWYDTFVPGYGLAVSKHDSLEAGDANMFFYNTGRFIAKAPQGTSPYQCVSTTVNANLNADLLDGLHEYSFLRHRDTYGIDGYNTLWAQIGIRQYNNAKPDGMANPIYDYGAVISLPGANTRLDIWYNHMSSASDSTTNGIQYRSGFNDDKKPWRMLLDSVNYASYSDGRYVKKSGDTMTGDLTMNNTKGFNIGWLTRVVKTSGVWIHGGSNTASSTDANLRFGSCQGIGWYPTIDSTSGVRQGNNAMWLNVRTGVLDVHSSITSHNGYLAANWDSARRLVLGTGSTYAWIDSRNSSNNVLCTIVLRDNRVIIGNYAESSRFVSTVGTGTAPYQCSSTTLNTNLNADLLDNWHIMDIPRNYNSTATYSLQFALGGTDNNWKKIFACSESGAGPYRSVTVWGRIWYAYGNHAQDEVRSYHFCAIFQMRSGPSASDSNVGGISNSARLYLPTFAKGMDNIRLVRVGTNNFELQVRQIGSHHNGYIQYQYWANGANVSAWRGLQSTSNTSVAVSAGGASTLADSRASSADVWTSARTFYIQDHDASHTGAGVNVNGSANVYLKLPNSIQCSDWFRSTGNSGWYHQNYGGGWYMQDSTYIRNYGSKRLRIQTDTYDTLQLVRTSGSGGSSIAFYNGGGTFRGQLGVNASSWFSFDTGTATANINVVEISPAGGIHSKAEITAKASGSDIRLKKDIQNYNAMNIINRFRSVKYHWNDIAKANSEVYNNDYDQFGLIAQDLIAGGFGQWVRDVFHDYYTVTYERLIPVVWKGLQEVDDEVTKLKREVARLNKRVKELEKSLCA